MRSLNLQKQMIFTISRMIQRSIRMKNVVSATGSIDTTGATTYYYQRNYYVLGDDGKAVSRTNTVTIPGNSNLMLGNYATKNTGGEYYIPAGTPRTTSLTYFAEDKAEGADTIQLQSPSILYGMRILKVHILPHILAIMAV